MALVLLLAILAQPAWAIAHAAIHDHLVHHPHHHGETDGHHHHGTDRSEDPRDSSGPRVAGDEHGHDHDHLEAMFVRPAQSADGLSFAAIPATESRWVVLPLHRRVVREGQPSRASPDRPDTSHPRAPPHA